MKTFDELVKLTDSGLSDYLQSEVELIIASAPSNRVLKLRHLQSKMDGIRKTIKDPYVRAQMIYNEMVQSLNELNDELKRVGFNKLK